jgi:hypothetical protein
MSRRGRILIGVGAFVVALLVAGFVIYRMLDDTEPVTTEAALELYRANPTPGEARAGLPAPGVYEYDVTGSERLARGPLEIDRELPPLAPMIVRHVESGYETDVRYSDSHLELSRYLMRPRGSFLTFARTVIKTRFTDTTRDRAWAPPLLRLPKVPVVGQTWGGTFTAGDLTLDIKSEVLKREAVAVGEDSIQTSVIEFRQEIRGDYTGRRTETFWYAADRGLIVKYAIESSLDGPTDFDITAEQTLRSLTPQV